jgi:hypothetical protein
LRDGIFGGLVKTPRTPVGRFEIYCNIPADTHSVRIAGFFEKF